MAIDEGSWFQDLSARYAALLATESNSTSGPVLLLFRHGILFIIRKGHIYLTHPSSTSTSIHQFKVHLCAAIVHLPQGLYLEAECAVAQF